MTKGPDAIARQLRNEARRPRTDAGLDAQPWDLEPFPTADDLACECGAEWVETMRPCPGCGLTIEQVAERVAAGRRSLR